MICERFIDEWNNYEDEMMNLSGWLFGCLVVWLFSCLFFRCLVNCLTDTWSLTTDT